MKGQYGLYIKYGKDMSFPLPDNYKDKEKDITYDKVVELIKEREPLGRFKSKDRMYVILKGKGDYSDYIRVMSTKQKGKQFYVPLPKNTNVKDLNDSSPISTKTFPASYIPPHIFPCTPPSLITRLFFSSL